MNVGMEIFDRVNALCQENGIASVHVLEGILGFGDGTIYKWKKSAVVQSDKLTAVADYFNVSTDFLLGRESNPSTEESTLIALFRRLSEAHKYDLMRIAELYADMDKPIAKDAEML